MPEETSRKTKTKKPSAWLRATQTVQEQSGKAVEPEKAIEVEPQPGITVPPEHASTVKPQDVETVKPESSSPLEPQTAKAVAPDSLIAGAMHNGIDAKPQPVIAVQQESSSTVEHQDSRTGEEQGSEVAKATEKVTLYLTPAQVDKLADFSLAYRKQHRKRMDPNKIMRILIDKATYKDLPAPPKKKRK